ncbi:MAG: M20/M25/M40 family metallo-hydrolase, partial [Pseudonocardia sp.]|nr:M20/M25/M40 family metallo-hydrolase [Pseudonocardia sp.]
QFAPGRTPVGSPVVAAVAAAHRAETGAAPALRGAPYGSDLRLLVAAGVPTVHYGPGSVRHAHAPDEHVPLDEVLGCSRTLVRLIASVCGGPDRTGVPTTPGRCPEDS